MMLALAAGSLQSLAETAYYRWVDDRGNMILSDRPPTNGANYEVVSTGAGFDPTMPTGDEDEAVATADPQPGQTSKAPQAISQKNPELCAVARNNLDALTSTDRVVMRDEQGQVKVLAPEEIKANIQTTRGQINAYCE